MKKLFLLFIIFLGVSNSLLSQSYELKIYNYVFDEYHDDDRCGTNNLWIDITYYDNTQERIYEVYNDDKTAALLLTKIVSKRIKSVFFHSFLHEKGGFPRDCNGDTASLDITSTVPTTGCIYQGHIQGNDDGGDARLSISLDYDINPVIELETPPSDLIGYEDEFDVSVTANSMGFNTSIYNWQYQVVDNESDISNNNWLNMPFSTATQGQTSFSLTPSSFLDESTIGKFLAIRVNTCGDLESPTNNVFKILPSAPHITAIENNTGLQCNGTDDAEITLVFDENLEPGESFALEVLDLSEETGTDVNGEPLYSKITIDPKFNNITADDIVNDRLTITGLPGSTDDGFRIEFLGGTTLFADGDNHKIDFDVYEPHYVSFDLSDSTKVNCKNGQDGTVLVTAEGGTEGNYQYLVIKPDGTDDGWKDFEDTHTHRINNLSAGLNKIKVMDGNQCVAKNLILVEGEYVPVQDEDKELTVTTEEPNNILALGFLQVTVDRLNESNDATANGFTDGRITAIVTGGTGPYTVVWKNSAGTVFGDGYASNTTFDDVEESQTFTLNNIGEGTYTLTVTDANHTQATQKTTCFAEGDFSIEDPDELLLTIEEANPVSCNSLNEFNNPVGDGQLVAHATGGIKLDALANSGLPYYYTWKKEDENGVFQILTEEKDSIISNLTAARYSVNIRDANGIVIGNYVNNSLVNETDVIHDLLDPEPFVITFTKGDLLCSDGTEGWAEATITGGTGSYTLNWSNGSTEPRIENLEKGTYLLFVTDEKGCQATSQVIIDAPNPLQVAILEENDPVCNNGSDGVISLGISGGLEDYTYNWLKDGNVIPSQTGFYANNLTAGTYTITVSDANLCSETVEITLENPSPDLISLGEDRLLCGGQSVVLDATYQGSGTTYLWTSDNGFTSTKPSIEVTEAGTYTVEVTTLLGCNGGDSIVITVSDTPIDAHFIVSTQAFAGEELALVNISEPIGDKVEWFLPEEAVVIAKTDENVILLFDEPGSYDILLRSNQGTCFLDYMKTIIIGEAENIPDIGDAETPFIQEFKIYPNPSSGQFYVDILLSEASPISLKIFSMASQGLVNERKEKAAVNFNLEYGTTLASGTYVLLLETAKGSEIRKIIIN
ncbi:putative secreted protein (Por secretion system target) [Cellulophaga sp. RHA_52]|uniref:T9SS type A sorting domain-containing protein n=1 Tax=Cellulophaga sp. RHA_52 TaxID=1250036 RepID=UPI001199EC5A|nr:T9SS type A sorting domain-containing protein [Cellulophaga sp. RHA_52]TVZ09756.1 putative secreted protein (Por secretion system target) [Cellulophaga sp. RHA_52]